MLDVLVAIAALESGAPGAWETLDMDPREAAALLLDDDANPCIAAFENCLYNTCGPAWFACVDDCCNYDPDCGLDLCIQPYYACEQCCVCIFRVCKGWWTSCPTVNCLEDFPICP